MECSNASLFSPPLPSSSSEPPIKQSHLNKLPLELIHLIIDHLAQQATSQADYFTDVQSLATAWFDKGELTQVHEIQRFVHQTLFFSKITACNRNLIAPKDLMIHSFSDLAHFLQTVKYRLYSLNLNQFGLQIDDQSLAQIVECCPYLEELHLGSARITDAGIDSLLKLRELRSLTLYALELKNFDQFTQLPLKELHITGAPYLLNSHLESFSKLPLKKLSLISCSKLTQECFSSIAKMSLDSLVFMQKSCAIPNMDEAEWQLKIHHLDLSRTALTKESMAMIAKCENLQTLILDDCIDLTDSMLNMIVDLPLKKLSLSKCKNLSDQALHSIAKMDSLEELNLAYCQKISDKGVKELAPLQLKIVNVGWCYHLSNEAIQGFDLKSMMEVKATECHQVTLDQLQLNYLQITDSQNKIFKKK